MKIKLLTFSSLLFLLFTSCDRIDPEIVPLIGVYEAHVQGLSGPFSMSISSDRADDVIIEAPFDGFEWTTLLADIDNQSDEFKTIDINDQEIGPGIFIEGEGFFFQGSLQLDYTIDFGNERIDFTIVGSRF